MTKIKRAVLIFFVLVLSNSSLFAVDVKALRDQAYTDVLTAVRLKQEAERTLKTGGLSEENLRTARTLYTEAGKLFERASRAYASLAPDNATEEDIEKPKQAMERCIEVIREIQVRLQAYQKKAVLSN